MPNNLSVSVTADVADLTSKLGVAQASLKETSKEFRSLASEMIASSAPTDELKTRYLEVSEAQAKASATVRLFTDEIKKATVAGRGLEEGHQRLGASGMIMQHVFRSTADSLAAGLPITMIFGEQISRLGEAAALSGAKDGALGRMAAFMTGPWGIAVTLGITMLGKFIGHLMEAKDALDDVKVATDELGSVQKAIGGVFDLTTGKMKNQTDAAMALAKATVILAQAQAQQRLEQAQGQISEARDGSWMQQFVAMGSTPRAAGATPQKPSMPAGQVLQQFASGARGASATIDALQKLQRAGRLTEEQFTRLSAAVANVAGEKGNLDELRKAWDSLASGKLDRSLANSEKPGKTKGARTEKQGNVVGEWDEELTSAKTAFAMLQQEQGTYESYSLAEEAKFWRAKIDQTEARSKDRAEVEKKWLAAVEALRKQGNAAALEAIKADEGSKMEGARQEVALGKLVLQGKLEDIAAAQQAGQITDAQALARKAAINRQMLQLDIDLITAEKAVTLTALNAQLAQQKLAPIERRKINDQILADTLRFNNQLALLNQRANNEKARSNAEQAQQLRSTMTQTYQGFAQQFAKLATLQQGWAATFKGLYQNLQGIVEQAISRMVTAWLVGLATKESAETAAHMQSMLKSAKEAAAGAWAAVAKIPIIGPVLAPIAAAAAFAGVMAFSAEDGWDVPGGAGSGVDGKGGRLGIIHPYEMVLPADIASPLRNMSRGGAAAGVLSLPAASNDRSANDSGDVHHHHYYQISAVDAHSVKRLAREHGPALATGIQKAVRNGFRGGR